MALLGGDRVALLSGVQVVRLGWGSGGGVGVGMGVTYVNVGELRQSKKWFIPSHPPPRMEGMRRMGVYLHR